MNTTVQILESERIQLQQKLDSQKTQAERNRLGQFATPPALAQAVIDHGISLLPADAKIHFLDPAFGSGAFYAALKARVARTAIAEAAGFEIDPHYGEAALRLWKETGLNLKLADFTTQTPSPQYNLLICNPPYVRHHHLSGQEKLRLQALALKSGRVKLSGLAGLYCYFLTLAHQWMAKEAVAGWLIPSEFMDVNYGSAIRQYLVENVTLLRIHRFVPTDVQFSDALVSSAVLWFQNSPPPKNHEVEFTLGGTLAKPVKKMRVSTGALAREKKWTRFPESSVRITSQAPRLNQLFRIKRGIATGDNSFFIISAEEMRERRLPRQLFRPILPSPRYLKGDMVESDNDGNPRLERSLFLLDSGLDEQTIKRDFPSLWIYLEEGRARGLHERYLCSHRSPWYSQESRPPAPIVCTYIGRSDTKSGRPFRFIRNLSQATVANVYLAMYPTPLLDHALQRDAGLLDRICAILNAIEPSELLGEGRVYGGGLHKLEPKELGNLPIVDEALIQIVAENLRLEDLFAA